MHARSGTGPTHFLARAALSALLAFGGIGVAFASPIPLIQSQSFGSAPAVTFAFDAFDTTLGTLESVQLEFVGAISATFTPLANAVNGVFTPYAFTGSVEQSFTGLGAFSSFGFDTPATFITAPLSADGLGTPVSVVLPFSWSMNYAALSDLLGFVLPSFSGATIPPVSVGGSRADFLGTALSPELSILGTVTPRAGGSVLGGFATMSGAAVLTYFYTPAPPPTDVPEPGTAGLMLLAVAAGLFVHRRRFPKRHLGFTSR